MHVLKQAYFQMNDGRRAGRKKEFRGNFRSQKIKMRRVKNMKLFDIEQSDQSSQTAAFS
jgi:hypothetical protein